MILMLPLAPGKTGWKKKRKISRLFLITISETEERGVSYCKRVSYVALKLFPLKSRVNQVGLQSFKAGLSRKKK